MRRIVRVLLGMLCGVIVGGLTLYPFWCLAFALGLLSANGLTLRANLSPEVLVVHALAGALVGSLGKARTAAVLAPAFFLLLAPQDIPSWADAAALRHDLQYSLIIMLPGGAAFGAAVQTVTVWAERRIYFILGLEAEGTSPPRSSATDRRR